LKEAFFLIFFILLFFENYNFLQSTGRFFLYEQTDFSKN